MKHALWAGLTPLLLASACRSPDPLHPRPTGHEFRQIHGWIVAVDHRLTHAGSEADRALGVQALGLLEEELGRISKTIPEKYVRKLRSIPIWLDKGHGTLQGEMYHPDLPWLQEHGFDPSLWRSVQVPRAAEFCDPARRKKEPLPLLHQLIHGFQNRAFGFDDPRILAGYERFKAKYAGRSVALPSGETGPHPGLKRPREYFLEMSLAYFDMGRVEPRTAGALKRDDPETYRLIEECWDQEG